MTSLQLLELAIALALVVGGIWLYRRGAREDRRHGSQGAVILLIVGMLVAVHALGLMDYRPSPSEIGR